MFALQTALKDLLRYRRDPLSFLLWVGIPVAIGLMIKLAFGGLEGGTGPTAEVLVVDRDDTVLSGLLVGAMGQQPGAELPFVAEEVELEEGRERIEDGDASALLIIPEGFSQSLLREQPCTLELVTNPAQRILPGMVEEALGMLVEAVFYAHRVFGQPIEDMLADPPEGASTLPDQDVARISITINQIMERIAKALFPPVIELVFEVDEAEEDEGGSPGFGELFFPSMIFMTLFFMASGVSEDVWNEKRMGTLRRALTTPHRASAFLLGKVLAASLLIALIGSTGFLLGRYAFGLELSNLPLAVLWTAVCGALFVLLLIPLQLLASSQRTGSLLTNMVVMPLLMIGGSFFPFEAMPEWMASIGRRTPNGWALVQFKAITGGGIEPMQLFLALAAVLAACGVLFLVSARRLVGFARS